MAAPLSYVDAPTLAGSWPILPETSVLGGASVLPRTLRSRATLLGVMRETSAGYAVGGTSFYVDVDANLNIQVTFVGINLTLSEVVSQFNAIVAPVAGADVAFKDNGFLKLQSPTVGESSYLNTRADMAGGGPMVLTQLGFFAEVDSHGGELESAPMTDPDRQVVIPGQMSMAEGESLDARTINRLMLQVAINADIQSSVLNKKRFAKTKEASVVNPADGFTLSDMVYTGVVVNPSQQQLNDLMVLLDDQGSVPVNENWATLDSSTFSLSPDPNTGDLVVVSNTPAFFTASMVKDPVYFYMVHVDMGTLSGKPLKIIRYINDTDVVVRNVDDDGVVQTPTVSSQAGSIRTVTYDAVEVIALWNSPSKTQRVEGVVTTVLTGVVIDRVEKNNRIITTDGSVDFTIQAAVGDLFIISGHSITTPFSNNGTYRISRIIDSKTVELVQNDYSPAFMHGSGVTLGTFELQHDEAFYLNPFVELSSSVAAGTYRVVYMTSSPFTEITEDLTAFTTTPFHFIQEDDASITESIRRILGPSASSYRDILYDDYRLSLEDLDFRLNDEHNETGRHTTINPDVINMMPGVAGQTIKIRIAGGETSQSKLTLWDDSDVLRFEVKASGDVYSRNSAGDYTRLKNFGGMTVYRATGDYTAINGYTLDVGITGGVKGRLDSDGLTLFDEAHTSILTLSGNAGGHFFIGDPTYVNDYFEVEGSNLYSGYASGLFAELLPNEVTLGDGLGGLFSFSPSSKLVTNQQTLDGMLTFYVYNTDTVGTSVLAGFRARTGSGANIHMLAGGAGHTGSLGGLSMAKASMLIDSLSFPADRMIVGTATATSGPLHLMARNITGLTVDIAGQVGVGQTSPEEQLHVHNPNSAPAYIKITGGGTGQIRGALLIESDDQFRTGGMYLFNSADQTTWYAGSGYSTADNFIIARKTGVAFDDTAATEANALFHVNSSGLVGIKQAPNANYELSTSRNSNGPGGIYLHNDNAGALAHCDLAIRQALTVGTSSLDLICYNSAIATTWGGVSQSAASIIRDNVGGATSRLMVGLYGDKPLHFITNSLMRMTILGSGQVGIGPNFDTTIKRALHVSGDMIRLATSETNLATKSARFGLSHYTTAEEEVGLVFGVASLAYSSVSIGGGESNFNAATKVSIWTAANTTTTTGTERLTVDSAGKVGINAPTPLDQLHLRPISYTSNQDGGIRLSDTGGNWDFRLALKSDGSGTPRWGFDTDTVADAMAIANSGRVGIGRIDPDSLLSMSGAGPELRIYDTLDVSTNLQLGSIYFGGNKSGAVHAKTARISAVANSTGSWSAITNDFAATWLEFYTQDGTLTDTTADGNARMRIDPEGIVHMTNDLVADRMQQVLSATINTAGTATAGTFNPFDTDTYGSGGNDLTINTRTPLTSGPTVSYTDGLFYVARAGVYHVTGAIFLIQSVSGVLDVFGIKKNGTTFIWSAVTYINSSVDPVERSFDFYVSLASGDYIEFLVDGSAAGTIQIERGTTLNLCRVV